MCCPPRWPTRCVGCTQCRVLRPDRALAPQCWAFRSLTFELNGSAVHAQFPDWPANESVPIVELMQLPVRTTGWISRGVNSSLANASVSTVGIRTNCACAACAMRMDVCELGSD